MAEIFAISGGNESDLSVPSPVLQGVFIPGIDTPDFQDGFGLSTPLGGGPTARRYTGYGVSTEVSNQYTQLKGLSNLALAPGASYSFEGLIGPQGIPGRDGITTIIHIGAAGPYNSNFLTALPNTVDQINDLGTDVNKMIYTSAYTPYRNDDWEELQPTGAENTPWLALAVNSDGSVIIAAADTVANGGTNKVYVSQDFGATFIDTGLGVSPTHIWKDVASSSDGTYLLAVSTSTVYLSNNSGSSFSDITPPLAEGDFFSCGAMDSDGSHIIVGEHNGRLWTSSDYGANWTERRYDGDKDRDYFAVASNSSGSQLIATDYYETSNPGLWISTDSGANWTDKTPGGAYSQLWQRVAMDDDGSHILAINYDPTKRRVFLSTDNGTSWAEVDHPDAPGFKDFWTDVALDSDGSHLMMSNSTSGRLYTSLDGGVTWERPAPSGLGTLNWLAVATISDGSIWLAVSFNSTDRIYQSSFAISYNRETWAEADLTSAGRALLDDANAAAQATTLGLGTGDAVTHDTLTLSSIPAESTDVDKFLVDSTGVIKFRTGAEVLSDIGASASAHLHDTQTLEHDGVNSDGGAFGFTTTGLVTFNQSIAAANYAAANLLTAAATNAGELDFTSANKKLDVEGNAVVDQDYSSDATPLFGALYLTDQSSAGSDTAGQGQFWVKDDTPDTAWFTNDNGDDIQLGELARISGSTYSTVQQMQDLFHSAGWVSGGVVSDNGNDTVAVTAGTGVIRASSGSTQEILFFDWALNNSLGVPANTTRYVGVEYNAGSPQLVVRTSDNFNNDTDFILASLINEASSIHVQKEEHAVGDHSNNMIQRLFDTAPFARDKRGGGLILGESGDNNRNLTMTAGTIWEKLNEFSLSAIDTSAGGGDTFDRYLTAGGGGHTKQSAQTTWDNTQFDSSGTLTVMTNNRYAVQWYYIELDGEFVSVYGTAQYTSEAAAENEAPPVDIPDRISLHGKLIGRLIFQKSDTLPQSVESVFTQTFTAAGVTDHGNLAGLADDDHTQYILHSLANVANDFLVASGANTFVKKTLAETGAILEGDIIHDNLQSIPANDHIDHTGVTLTAGSGIAGGGDISTGRTFDLDINSLSVATIVAGDFVPFWDITATATNKKTTFANFESALNHDALINYAANEHFTQASITAVGTIATGTWQATDVGISYGGTGQSTAQLAINALSAVSGATNEHVLTKDTGTGNAVWKVAAGGGGDEDSSITWNMLTDDPDVIGQGTWTRAATSTYPYNGYLLNSSTNNGDNLTLNFRCSAGTYKLGFNASKGTNRGIIDIYFDASEEGSFDLYGSTDTANVEIITGISLTAGAHTLKFQIDGKNGSATDYVFVLQGVHLIRTA